MAANKSPYPAFTKIFYHSEFAPHVMTVPTRAFNPPNLIYANGYFNCWDSSLRGAPDMIEDIIALLAADYTPNVTFDRYEIWSKSSPDAIPSLVYNKPHTVVGSNTETGTHAAVQKTFVMRAADNSEFKFVELDIFTDNIFGRFYDISGNPTASAIVTQFMASDRAWQTRKGAQPIFFRSTTITLTHHHRFVGVELLQ